MKHNFITMFQYSLILVTLIAAQSFFENPYF